MQIIARLMIVCALAIAFLVGPGVPAQAADSAWVDCSKRTSTWVMIKSNDVYRNVLCGKSINGPGNNDVTHVVDSTGPICVYFGTTLAGCASKSEELYIGNRVGAAARVVPQRVTT